MGSVASAILRGAAVAHNSGKFDPEERKKWMNASEAMTCLRKQWYGKNDAEKDGPEEWGYAHRGTHGEEYIVERLRLANIGVIFGGEDQVGIADEETGIACTPDGLIWAPSLGTGLKEGWIAAEFKTIDPRTNIANLPKRPHIAQVQIAADLFSKHADDFPELQGFPLIGCKIIYMDCSNFNKVYEFDVPLKIGICKQLAPRARRMLTADSANRLPREGTHTPGKRECKTMCPFNRVCGVDGVEKATEAAKSHELTAARTRYISAKADEDEAKTRRSMAAEEIKSALHEAGQSSMQIDEGEASLSSQRGRINYKKVTEDFLVGIDLEPYRGEAVEKLTVK